MLYFNSAMKGRLYSACLVLLHQHVYLTLKLRCKRCVCKGGHSLSLLPDSWGRPDQIPRKEPFSLNPNHAEGLLPITLRFTWPSAAIPTLAKNIFHTSFITTSSSHICQRKEEKKKKRGEIIGELISSHPVSGAIHILSILPNKQYPHPKWHDPSLGDYRPNIICRLYWLCRNFGAWWQ